MKPRLGFALSLLAACGLHAAVLLVPQPAGGGDSRIPTIELTLSIGAAETSVGVERAAPRPRRGAIPAVQAAPTGPAEERPAPAPTMALDADAGGAPVAAQAEDATAPAAEAVVAAASAGPPTNAAAAIGSAAGGGQAAEAAGTGAEADGGAGGGAVEATTPGLTPPHALVEIRPVYPRSARASGLQGTVKIAALIDKSGALVSVEVLASSGHASLDRAALEAVRRTAFQPAILRGKAVLCRVIIPIRFQLN